MFKKAIFGFDSAWTDNPNQPGAIAALVNNKDGWSFIPPRLANFADTESFIRGHSAELQIIALDQPTIVINETGMRPFERVVGSIVNKLGGGVQPANRSKTTMFGNGAPVWRFINQLRPIQNPFLARSAQNGCYLLEVFPALALPILIPTIWNCKRAAKYNPTVTANFSLEDWRLISMGLAEIATSENLESLVTLLRSTANLVSPKRLSKIVLIV